MTDFNNRDLSPAQDKEQYFQLGLDRERFADFLIYIANGIKDNTVIVKNVKVERDFVFEDFNPETISFKFHELFKKAS